MLADAPTKKSLAIKLFQFCNLKKQQRYILQEEVNISKRDLTCLVDSLCGRLKTFDHAIKCVQIPLPKPKVEIGSTKSEDNLFAYYYYDIIELPHRQNRLSFRFANNNSCVFSMEKFDLHGNQFLLTQFVNINQRENHNLYKNRYYVRCEQMWNNWEQLQCVAHSPLIVSITIALLVSLGTRIVQIQSVR